MGQIIGASVENYYYYYYLFLGPPLLGCPSTSILITLFVIWLSSFRIACPYQANLMLLNFSVTDATFKLPLIYSFLIQSILVTLHIHHNIRSCNFRPMQSPFILHLSDPAHWSIQHDRFDDWFIDFPLEWLCASVTFI
jgi:hypothetical protein